jgi:hypothetical protein
MSNSHASQTIECFNNMVLKADYFLFSTNINSYHVIVLKALQHWATILIRVVDKAASSLLLIGDTPLMSSAPTSKLLLHQVQSKHLGSSEMTNRVIPTPASQSTTDAHYIVLLESNHSQVPFLRFS